MAPKKWHNIVVCCDGSWCGEETKTRTNIQILADAFATTDPYDPVHVGDGAEKSRFNHMTNTNVVYFNGVGTSGMEAEHKSKGLGMANYLLGGSLDMLVYIINGALARDLDDRCKEAYKFIKENYRGPDESRIWLFGLSRGAYTVRAVAGMINNCGIMKKDWAGVPGETLQYSQEVLLQAVWDIYSSNDADCHPRGPTSLSFQRDDTKVWRAGSTPPIVFMGLLDTVGAVGLPNLNGVGIKPLYSYIPLRDLAVSTEVQNVFQACSTHDRLTLFSPCFVRRNEPYDSGCVKKADVVKVDGTDQNGRNPKYTVQYNTEEVWYPGAHYDLGRQNFVFGNQPLTNAFNELFNVLRTNVKCLPELGDYPLVGYELQPKKGAPEPPNCTLDCYPPCIVGRVCSIDSTILPLPSESRVWAALAKGIPLSDANIVPWGHPGYVRSQVQAAGQRVVDAAELAVHDPETAVAALGSGVSAAGLRGVDAVQRSVESAAGTAMGWVQRAFGTAVRAVYEPMTVAAEVAAELLIGVPTAALHATAELAAWGIVATLHSAITVGKLLPAPFQEKLPAVFRPAYTIDGETKILTQLGKYGGVILNGRYDGEWLLKDRTIPLPGVDDWGFKLVGEANFFPVPKDKGSYASYKASENQEWFMSKTYNNYKADLAAGKKNDGEKKCAALRAAGRQGTAAVATRQATAAQQQQQQGAPGKMRPTATATY